VKVSGGRKTVNRSPHSEQIERGHLIRRTLGSLLIIGSILVGCQPTARNSRQPASADEHSSGATKLFEFRLEIEGAVDTGIGEQSFMVLSPPNISVLDFLRLAAAQKAITLDDYSQSAEGAFIKSINGLENSPAAGRYWIYYVNGEIGKVSCSAKAIRHGDVIRFNYQETPY